MDIRLVKSIASQLPPSIVVQFHNNGEPLLYPEFGWAVNQFKGIRCMDTNGKLLVEKADEILHLDTIAISVFENDPESFEQFLILKEFMHYKGNRKPLVVARLLGKVNPAPYMSLGCLIAKRVLHDPMGSFDYQKQVTVPEIGICLDLLNRMSIRWDGKVSHCVRFDPHGLGIIGDATKESLESIWNGEKRQEYIRQHIAGHREKVPLCETCEYWGVPTG